MTRRTFTGTAASALFGTPGVEAGSTSGDWFRRYVETGFYPPITYLLIDDLFITRKHGVARTLGRPQKYPNPVLDRDRPWEVGLHNWFINGLLYDEEEKRFKLWYLAHDPEGVKRESPEILWEWRWAYATSIDCIHWEKPELGLVEWGGSRRNNLVSLPYPVGGDGPLANVVKDTREADPNRRYKGLGMERHKRKPGERVTTWPGIEDWLKTLPDRPKESPLGSGLYLYVSPNGFRWKRHRSKLMSQALVMDGLSLHGFDEDLQAWILWPRARVNPKFRTIGVSITADLERIPYPQMILAPDAEDPPGTQFDRLVTIKVPGGYVGLLRSLVEPKASKKIEAQLAFSRDGRVWTRPAGREGFLTCQDGTWYDKSVCPAHPIQVGDEIFILSSDNTVVPGGVRIGLSKMKRDRWAAIEPVSNQGVLETKPLCFANRFIQVNADATRGSLRAELLYPDSGKPLPGYSVDDSDSFTGDGFSHMLSWKGKTQLPEQIIGSAYVEGLPGRVLSIRFYLDRARLYAFAC